MKVGISSCLLGNEVRYDGQHKLDRFLRDELGKYVEWYPLCPEMECGLPIPRESMRLVGDDPENPRLLTVRSKRDITPQMENYTVKRLDQLASEKLRGFVFKSKSPTSGMRGVKIYTEQGLPSRSGSGIFAREFMKRFPNLPAEDEGRLHDAAIRENFIETLFVFDRWRTFLETDASPAGLIAFHSTHKYLLMAHAPAGLREAGKIVAAAKRPKLQESLENYESVLIKTLRLHATVKKHVNVLQHIMGYFKDLLSSDEKQELLEVIARYAKSYVPLIVPIVLLNHYVRKYDEPYLKNQWYLHPHPDELKLRNHA
ncbi:MAG: DUF523 and DUF1722 domain-containing protein [Candidatus Neomarinimicrobiota bacterium]|jgi:uncharacterized protein YbgA (DUF1722 family)/uncharacterized protein YbbK (DUF523 family)|nr:DUF523 and DUF1722 domain-containing protein [Candidatus Neomarinimicrobiota bacterium]MDD3965880.1 DUF523 and DUF1722 domain-containing protein [Candidatus Neomarinimicrobiota bacterium]MDX9780696.1 DUF523 and DUF1722 domain-containing protein [bacterium]